MGNLDFVTTKKNIEPALVDLLIKRACRRLGAGFEIDRPAKRTWFVKLKPSKPSKEERFQSFEMGMRSPRKLWFNSGASFESEWLTYSVKTMLALELDGTISGEGDDVTWLPDPKRGNTFKDWVNSLGRGLAECALDRPDPRVAKMKWNQLPRAKTFECGACGELFDDLKMAQRHAHYQH